MQINALLHDKTIMTGWVVKPVIVALKNDCQSLKDWQSLMP